MSPSSWANAAGGGRRLSNRTERSDKTRFVIPPATRLVVDLLGSSPNVLLFVKRPDGRYLEVNDTFVRRMRCADRSELIGKTVDDFFPPDLAAAYRAEDRALLQSGRPRRNQLEVITDVDGRREWFLSTRVLHRHHGGGHGGGDGGEDGADDVIVAVSTQTGLGSGGALGGALRAALDVAARGDRRLRVSDLADAAGLSTDQLERAMRRVLGVSPKQHLMALRLDRAVTLLATTDDSLSDVAAACHYYDQSQFTKYFKDAFGVTPRQFRAGATGRP